MYTAYSNILRRCGLKFRAVEADSGAIGGSGSTEFMVLAEAGEDEVLYTDDGQYAANVEKAVSLPADVVPSELQKFEKLETPNTPTIESLAKFLKCSPTQIVKNVLYQATFDSGKSVLVLVSIRGDQDVNDVKLIQRTDQTGPRLRRQHPAGSGSTRRSSSAKVGCQTPAPGLHCPGPGRRLHSALVRMDIAPKFLRMLTRPCTELKELLSPVPTSLATTWSEPTGAKNSPCPNWWRMCAKPRLAIAPHDPSQTLQTARGIEIGHIFQLGTKYSKAMGATYTSESGEEVPLEMGCYGVGVSRLAQAAVEQSYDKNGIIWPVAIAPYHAIVVIPNISDDLQVETATTIYEGP
jgi:prolyl-tRNA synthetase